MNERRHLEMNGLGFRFRPNLEMNGLGFRFSGPGQSFITPTLVYRENLLIWLL
jgi:hypothetical protein